MKKLENYGVVSLDNKEMNETDGGSILGAIALGITIIGGIAYVVDNWDSVTEGWQAGAEAAANN